MFNHAFSPINLQFNEPWVKIILPLLIHMKNYLRTCHLLGRSPFNLHLLPRKKRGWGDDMERQQNNDQIILQFRPRLGSSLISPHPIPSNHQWKDTFGIEWFYVPRFAF
ncbi:hypothetical protein CDAR_607541 [Caerostris darwini]|uniref:Ycf15 n=1 Tax=Caerostris darwini TaxID=1538125 RepID=A0AAV4RLE3_9ARAC|nr:hypothetical protein CDAR_607541 [Caerostris darwini]